MGMKYDILNIRDVSKEHNNRLDHAIYYAEKKFNDFIEELAETKLLGFFISDIRNGQDISKDYYTDIDTGVLYISVTQISSGIASKLNLGDVKYLDIPESQIKLNIEAGDILITRSGTPGVAWYAEEEFVNNYDKLIPSGYIQRVKIKNDDLSPRFLSAYLNTPPVRMLTTAYSCGKDQFNISQDYIKKIPVPVISSDEKESMIAVLEEINARVEKIQDLLKYFNKLQNLYSVACLKGELDSLEVPKIKVDAGSKKLVNTSQKWQLPKRRDKPGTYN